jgi:hypothetical protein
VPGVAVVVDRARAGAALTAGSSRDCRAELSTVRSGARGEPVGDLGFFGDGEAESDIAVRRMSNTPCPGRSDSRRLCKRGPSDRRWSGSAWRCSRTWILALQ